MIYVMFCFMVKLFFAANCRQIIKHYLFDLKDAKYEIRYSKFLSNCGIPLNGTWLYYSRVVFGSWSDQYDIRTVLVSYPS